MINIFYSWLKTYTAKRVIKTHSHDFYEFVYYISGSGKTTIGAEEYTFSPGTYTLLPPSIPHDERHDGESFVYVVGFECDINFPLIFSETENVRISLLVNEIKKEQIEKNSYYDKMVEALIQEILVILQRGNINLGKKGYVDVISNAVKFIDEYYLTKIDLTELSKNAGYCSDRFRILFKQQVGLNPKEYILLKKLEEAKRMLSETNDSIDQISDKLGFIYCSRFSAFFKAKTGLYPSEYRKNIRN